MYSLSRRTTYYILLSTVSTTCARARKCSHLNTPSLWFKCAGELFNNCAILDDYIIEREPIGVGGFGTVHLGTHRETKKNYAVKYMDITSTRKFAQTTTVTINTIFPL